MHLRRRESYADRTCISLAIQRLANILGQFQWITCPRKDLSTGWLHCDPEPLFKPEHLSLTGWVPGWCVSRNGKDGGQTVPPANSLFQALLYADPFDVEAQKKIKASICQKGIDENWAAALEHNPESFARVIMLYVDMEVNGVPLKVADAWILISEGLMFMFVVMQKAWRETFTKFSTQLHKSS